MTERKRIIALGFFDGVHLGHGRLMEMTAKRASELDAEPAVVSFDTHPDTLIKGEPVPLINSAADRREVIDRLFGIRTVILVHFDQAMMGTPWERFAAYLRSDLNAAHLVVGHDFRFGYRGEGTTERLRAFCRENGMGIDVIDEVEMDGITVSSTYIRQLLLSGEMERANAFLGHPYFLTDIVRKGFQFGRTIDAPTINMRYESGVLEPRHGVYATKACFDGREHMAVTNVGVRPTVSGSKAVSVESFILDFSGDLYGREVRLDFYAFLRPEVHFASTDQLRDQIASDALQVRAYFQAREA